LAVGTAQTVGHRYAYRVRARDNAGNWSAWAVGPSHTAQFVQDGSTAVRYGGAWTRLVYANASGGTTRYTFTAGASARLPFRGRSVAVVAPMSSTRGSIRVYFDGVLVNTVSLRSWVTKSRQVVFTKAWGAIGDHTIEVRAVGNGRVDLDAFVVLR
jgi:hypothetical protein